jgi:general secretion pathway protein N
MKRWAWLGALVGVLMGLVVAAPAAWLAPLLGQASAGRIQLLGVRGSLWDGSGQLVLRDGAAGSSVAVLPTPLAWSLRPHTGGLSLSVSSDCCTEGGLRAELGRAVDGWGVRIADGASRWPTALMAGLGAPWNTVGLQGMASLRTQGLSVEWSADTWQMRGSAVLEATDLASSLSTLRPLGSYRLRLDSGPAGSVLVQVETLSGPLRMTAGGDWKGQRLHLRGEASAEAGAEDALGNLLNILGRRDGARSVITLN